MEEAKEKLAQLIKKSQEDKHKLSSIKSIKKFEKYLSLSFKWKGLLTVVILSAVFSQLSHLFHSKKVNIRN